MTSIDSKILLSLRKRSTECFILFRTFVGDPIGGARIVWRLLSIFCQDDSEIRSVFTHHLKNLRLSFKYRRCSHFYLSTNQSPSIIASKFLSAAALRLSRLDFARSQNYEDSIEEYSSAHQYDSQNGESQRYLVGHQLSTRAHRAKQ